MRSSLEYITSSSGFFIAMFARPGSVCPSSLISPLNPQCSPHDFAICHLLGFIMDAYSTLRREPHTSDFC